MFQIEKNVPAPERLTKSKYPFANMEVGDSFAVPADKFDAVVAAGSEFARKNKEKNIKFSYSRKNLRVWRIS